MLLFCMEFTSGLDRALWEINQIVHQHPGFRTNWVELQQNQLSAGNTTQIQQGGDQDLRYVYTCSCTLIAR